MAEPARQQDWDEDGSEQHDWKPHVIRGNGTEKGRSQAPLYAVPSNKNPEDEPPGHATKVPYLRSIEGNPNAEQEPAAAEPELNALDRVAGDFAAPGDGKAAAAPDSLKYSEEESKSKLPARLKSLGKKALSHKWLLGGALGSVLGLLGILAGLLLIASLLKIPNIGQNIVEYEFARMNRQFADSVDRTTSEALSVETTSDTPAPGEPEGLRGVIADKYQTLRDNTWGKLDKYRPDKVIENMKEDGTLKLNTHNTRFGNTVLDSVELDGVEYTVPAQRGFFRSFIPEFMDIPYLKSQVKFAQDFAPALKTSLEADSVGPIIRSFVANNIRQELGINLVAWDAAKFTGKTEAEADLEMNREAYNDIGEGGTEAVQEGLVSDINNAEQQAQDTTTQDVANDASLTQIIKNNGVDKVAVNEVQNAVQDSVGKQIVGFLNPAYQIALPACIIYEGSLDQAGPSINSSVRAQEAAFYMVASAADQQKAGGSTTVPPDSEATAVGAFNDKLGDVTKSNPYLRANGSSVDTAASSMSAEASPMGDFTLIDAIPLLGGSAVGNVIKSVANQGCPILTNIWVAVGSGVLLQLVSIIADIFTAGGATVGEETATVAADATVEAVSTSITERFLSALAQRFTAARIKSFLFSSVKDAATITALTIIAKLIVLFRSNGMFNGLEQNADFVNEADAGGNIHAGELERQQLFGRPLTCAEVLQSNQEDKTYIASVNAAKSPSERYLDPNNPDSLITHVAMLANAEVGGSLPNAVGNIFNIVSGPISFRTLLQPFMGIAHAALPCSRQDYGNVQFGWSQSEENIIHNNTSYLPLENQQILDQSGKEDQIAQTYASCFGYKYDSSGTSLDPTDQNSKLQSDITGDGSLGTLLTGNGTGNPSIYRDSNGDVITNQGLCSPQNLGANNPTYGGLVLRWRLAMQYDTTMQQLRNMQTVSQ